MKLIKHNGPNLGDPELAAVATVFRHGQLVNGPELLEFNNRIKSLSHKKYSISTNSGTAALHLALLALGVKEGDEVILPNYTAPDILNAIFYVRAKPVPVDIQKNGVNIDPTIIKSHITKKTKVLIIPHTFGDVANIPDIKKIGLPVIEDCAQALGSKKNGQGVGCNGEIAVFSYFATKILSTGGQGGSLTTNSKKIYDYVSDLINYNGRDNYKIRFNYPLTNLSAAIGNAQLSRLDEFIERRRQISISYMDILEQKGVNFWPKERNNGSNYFRFFMILGTKNFRDRLRKEFLKKNIEVKPPLSEFELINRLLKVKDYGYENSIKLARTSLSLPIHTSLTDSEVSYISNLLKKLL